LWRAGRGDPAQRLVGMEFASVAATMALAVLAIAWNQGFVLIIPLVLVSVTLPGTMVYIRLLVGKT
jgi:multicomponent Na+:H+ antiporter subunit F